MGWHRLRRIPRSRDSERQRTVVLRGRSAACLSAVPRPRTSPRVPALRAALRLALCSLVPEEHTGVCHSLALARCAGSATRTCASHLTPQLFQLFLLLLVLLRMAPGLRAPPAFAQAERVFAALGVSDDTHAALVVGVVAGWIRDGNGDGDAIITGSDAVIIARSELGFCRRDLDVCEEGFGSAEGVLERRAVPVRHDDLYAAASRRWVLWRRAAGCGDVA
jgi:hypothetical protein